MVSDVLVQSADAAAGPEVSTSCREMMKTRPSFGLIIKISVCDRDGGERKSGMRFQQTSGCVGGVRLRRISG